MCLANRSKLYSVIKLTISMKHKYVVYYLNFIFEFVTYLKIDPMIDGFFSFFVPLFVVLLRYWFLSVPLTLLLILVYVKTERPGVRRVLRILFSILILSAIFTLIYWGFY